jgi:hypothetical protein
LLQLLFLLQLLLLLPKELLLLLLLKSVRFNPFLQSVVLDGPAVKLEPVVDLFAEVDLVLLFVVVVAAAAAGLASFLTRCTLF